MQTDDTLILANQSFAIVEKEAIHSAKIMIKTRERSSTNPESAKKLDFDENGETQRSIHFSAKTYIFQRKLKFSI
jgi:hypothetical protein